MVLLMEHCVNLGVVVMQSSSLLDSSLGSSISTPNQKAQAARPSSTTSDAESVKNSHLSPTSVQLSFSPLSSSTQVRHQISLHDENDHEHKLENLLLPSSQEMEREPTNQNHPVVKGQMHDLFLETACDSSQSDEVVLPFAINEEDEIMTKPMSPGASHDQLVVSLDKVNFAESLQGSSNHQNSSIIQNSSMNSPLSGASTDFFTDNYNGNDIQDGQKENFCADSGSLSTLIHQHTISSTGQPTTNWRGSSTWQGKDLNTLKFSTLMEQADDKEGTLLEEPSFLDSSSYQVLPSMQSNPNPNPINEGVAPNNFGAYNRSRPILEDISTHSFRVSITTSPGIDLRDAFDVVSNPELLRHWCEAIDALVVVDHKGGSSPTSSMYTSKEEMKIQFVERPIEEFDDDMIVPPAEAQRFPRPRPDREYEGEWIQASTSSIVSPHSHSSILDDCVKKTRDIFGFPYYGTVSMFIERNLHRVGFTVGPFKGGITLSHKLELKNNETRGVIITDEVKVMTKEGEEKEVASSYCTCFEPLQGLVSEWLSPGMDGYVDQTQQSLLNLVWLIEKGGGMAYDANLIVASAEDELREPLLV